MKQVKDLPAKKKILGDRAYISKTLQMDLFEQYKVTLKVPFRNNQIYYTKHTSNRQMVETCFAQMCDQLNLKRNYAKFYEGLATR